MNFLRNNTYSLIGIVIGSLAGYAYYFWIGCEKGCAITGNPINSTLYGSIMGGLLFSIVKKEKKDTINNEG